MDLSTYLESKYPKQLKYYKCQYHVGKEKFTLTMFTNKENAIKHCDNLGLTLIEAD
jgi:hypothetical protein